MEEGRKPGPLWPLFGLLGKHSNSQGGGGVTWRVKGTTRGPGTRPDVVCSGHQNSSMTLNSKYNRAIVQKYAMYKYIFYKLAFLIFSLLVINYILDIILLFLLFSFCCWRLSSESWVFSNPLAYLLAVSETTPRARAHSNL